MSDDPGKDETELRRLRSEVASQRRDIHEMDDLVTRLAAQTAGLGVEMVLVHGCLREPDGSERERVVRFFAPAGRGVVMEIDDSPARPLRPLDEGTLRIVSARRRGMLHPAEIVRLLAPEEPAPGLPAGEFTELELDGEGRLVPVDRPPATNPTGIVVGLVRNVTERYPEGMLRVALFGDPTRALGSLAEPECRRIIAALDLAEERGAPLEWFALSAGAKIAWTRARRTWTGSPRYCGGSSSSRRRAASSTSSCAASTSARSHTGTRRRRCSCTPAASW